MSNTVISIRPDYKSAEGAALEQTSAPVAQPDEPALETLLDELDSALTRFDELTAKDRNFPSELAAIETKRKSLVSQELDSVEAIQSRSAEASKLSAMQELAVMRQKKVRNLIESQQEIVIKLGERIAAELERLWWNNYVKRAEEIKAEFDRLFYRCGLAQDLQDSYVPLVLLQWRKPPNFNVSRFAPPETSLVKCPGSVNRPISLKNSKNCRSKRLAIAWMKRIAEPGSKRKNVGTSESELGVSSTEGQADRPSRLAAG